MANKYAVILSLCLVAGGAFADDMNKKAVQPPLPKINAQPVVVTGEVVDAWCWSSGVMGPGRGPQHKACALACIAGGVSAGIVDDQGNLYIAAKHKAYSGCKDLLLPFVAKRVIAKGFVARRGGCQILKITDVKEAK